MQKAITVTTYEKEKSDGEKYSIERFNELLQEGWKVITCSPIHHIAENSPITEFLVVIEDSEKRKNFKPEFE